MATIRIDDGLKKEADEMFDELGMNTSVAVKIFLTRFVKTGKFPFEIEMPESTPNQETIRAFRETEQMIQQNDLKENDESLTDYFERIAKEANSNA
ncbi:type II toxin-antitoxin system RelB/DinJ family antitoxin [Candidatus Enterococcus murrayae]|uniref:Type II toxin-antitoxin system RelB/DinJ family antitoxin n=1 Tax=Candidatus Enterococcus murrayae TaxID=2815321 RepID=A0ABS3HMD0_9ENTE|nr:type II toxin-antitoxin system RelB/DinJ family antitoxin [Enterococcus sp. MJM16]MBO0454616.1 type II toxin-antitoxin system RelB/DinJ family antitoxin [Enterococcus sp. MJM16]